MKTIKRLVELSKRVLLGLTLGMLLVSCTTDPIQEQEQVNVIEQPVDIITYCTFTEELPYIITEYSQVNWQSKFKKYKKTYRSKNLITGIETITRVETYITTVEKPANELYTWICN